METNEFVGRQKLWLDNNIEDLIRSYDTKFSGDGASQMRLQKPFKVRYDNLDEFLTEGIQSGGSTFYDFGELSPEMVGHIREKTNLDLSGYLMCRRAVEYYKGEDDFYLDSFFRVMQKLFLFA